MNITFEYIKQNNYDLYEKRQNKDKQKGHAYMYMYMDGRLRYVFKASVNIIICTFWLKAADTIGNYSK